MGIQGKENATTHTVTYATQSSRAAFQSSGSPPLQLTSVSCKKLVSLWPCSPAAYIGTKRKGRQGYRGMAFLFKLFSLNLSHSILKFPSQLSSKKLNKYILEVLWIETTGQTLLWTELRWQFLPGSFWLEHFLLPLKQNHETHLHLNLWIFPFKIVPKGWTPKVSGS